VAWGVNRIANRSASRVRRQAGILASSFAAVLVVFGLIQLVSYGKSHSDPPVTGEPAWATPETRELMVRACYGCHSNEVVYPSYADIAPISWMVASHVSEGRNEVNFSDFATSKRGFDDTIELILNGSMPLSYYTQFGRHPEARLTDAEIATLVDGLRATPGFEERERRGDRHGDDD
jgi:mono/diheme cytochrome c family protein